MFRLGRSGEWRKKKRWETASTVAGNPRVIWDHPGSSSVGGAMCMCVCVCVCVCVCAHARTFVLGLGAGRHRETSALDPRAGLECVYM